MKLKSKNRMRLIVAIVFILLSENFISIQKTAKAIMHIQENIMFNQETLPRRINLKNYYYSQLNSKEKALYSEFINSKESFLNGEEVTITIDKYEKDSWQGIAYYHTMIVRVIKAYTNDNPEAQIWLDNYKREYYCYKGCVFLKLEPIPNPETNNKIGYEENVREALEKLKKVSEEFVKNLSGTEEEKLKQIHDWLIDRATYDKTLKLPNTRTLYGTIIEGRSICSGFAYAYKYIANLAGLNVLYVTGNVKQAEDSPYEPHAWNIAELGGKYFLIDVTFDNALNKTGDKFSLSPVENNLYYINTDYFTFPFKK